MPRKKKGTLTVVTPQLPKETTPLKQEQPQPQVKQTDQEVWEEFMKKVAKRLG